MSVVAVRDFGRGKAQDQPLRIVDDFVEYVPHVKIEIVCLDERVDEIVSTIQKNVHTGLRGDGKIYVSNIERAVRFSTGRKGMPRFRRWMDRRGEEAV